MKKIVMANWKMNMDNKKSLEFADKFENNNAKKVKVIIAPSFTSLPSLSVANKDFELSAQNVSQYDEGAYTGEVSASMLKELKLKYCLVGHSERRIYHHEDDATVNEKVKQLQRRKIVPVICFGETQAQRKNKETRKVVTRQIKKALQDVTIQNVILAYEPIWAISTFQKGKDKQSASEEDIASMHAFIKDLLYKEYGEKGKKIPLLYGGSVNPDNSETFINYDDVDGVLVGGASLQVNTFTQIINNVD